MKFEYGELPIEEIMERDVITINPEQTVHDASELMTVNKVGTLPVVENDGSFIGMITDRDIVVRCVHQRKDIVKTKIKECMTENPYKAVPCMPCSIVMFMMSRCGLQRIPVVKNDKLVGIVSISDIARVYNYCPNGECLGSNCILVDLANEIQKTSHLKASSNLSKEDVKDCKSLPFAAAS